MLFVHAERNHDSGFGPPRLCLLSASVVAPKHREKLTKGRTSEGISAGSEDTTVSPLSRYLKTV